VILWAGTVNALKERKYNSGVEQMKKIALTLSLLPVLTQAALIDETSWNSLVDLKSKKVIIQGESNYYRPLICKKVLLDIEVSSMISNTVVSNYKSQISNLYLYPDYNERVTSLAVMQKKLLQLEDDLEQKLIITNANIDVSKAQCQLATFHNYCDHAPVNDYEKASLLELMRLFKQNSCRGVSNKLFTVKKLNLNNSKVMSYEFLSVMKKIKRVSVNGSFQDVSKTIENLENIHFDGQNKMVPFIKEDDPADNQPVNANVTNGPADIATSIDRSSTTTNSGSGRVCFPVENDDYIGVLASPIRIDCIDANRIIRDHIRNLPWEQPRININHLTNSHRRE
jgi:hypothetical protein